VESSEVASDAELDIDSKEAVAVIDVKEDV